MTYLIFNKWGINLPVQKSDLSEPLKEQEVRAFVVEAITRTLEDGNDPIQQAKESEAHPSPVGNPLYEGMSNKELTDWIMGTEEMQQALTMFLGEIPNNPTQSEITVEVMTEEQVEMTDVRQLLNDLQAVEGDWM